MGRLAEVFANCRAEGRAALIGYLPSGFPDQVGGMSLIAAMVENGVDIIEVGLPYSDPLMDGPTIQAAVETSLAAGSTVSRVLETVSATAATGATALVMSYWNPIEAVGVQAFADRLAAAGGAGVITPDLTPEEAGPWLAATDAAMLDRVFLVAPSSPHERLELIAGISTGFVYAASTMGVTGARAQVGAAARGLVERTREVTELPVCVGLGVSTPEQASEVASYADGVIVGSAFVARVLGADSLNTAVREVGALARALSSGVRGRL